MPQNETEIEALIAKNKMLLERNQELERALAVSGAAIQRMASELTALRQENARKAAEILKSSPTVKNTLKCYSEMSIALSNVSKQDPEIATKYPELAVHIDRSKLRIEYQESKCQRLSFDLPDIIDVTSTSDIDDIFAAELKADRTYPKALWKQ